MLPMQWQKRQILRVEEITKSDPPSIMEKAEIPTFGKDPNIPKNTAKGMPDWICACRIIHYIASCYE